MPEVELAAGTIEYHDTGGDGPVLVFLHGLTMDGSLWRKVVPGLAADYRCVLPTLPLGGHRRRLADLFPDARLVEIDDSYTLLPEDQPEQLIRAIRDFVPPYAGTHR